MTRRSLFLLILVCAFAGLSGGGLETASARPPAPGPRIPPRPKPERTDAELFAKAARIQARMWKHISPEGLLVYVHRKDATPDQLSHDALSLADAAIWTGCYAGAQACRWHVTRDPEALMQVRHLARGLAMLTDVTGVPGALTRNVGRPLPGEPLPKHVETSRTMPGYAFRGDVSRDQLAGVTLGWALVHRFVEDEALRALAGKQMGAIAARLYDHDLHLRDPRGKRTEHGELAKDLDPLGVVKNGQSAAIGYATFAVAAGTGGGAWCSRWFRRLQKEGWREALGQQHVGIKQHLSASNVQMTELALLSIRLMAKDGKSQRSARKAFQDLRRATRGWWNGALCACPLLAGIGADRASTINELRVVLHVMSEAEVPPQAVDETLLRRAATVRERGNSTWSWKSLATRKKTPRPGTAPHPTHTHTRADWLFAYWLARAAGELKPRTGPGAGPTPISLDIPVPTWVLGHGGSGPPVAPRR